MTNRQARLEAIQKELSEQDRIWQQAREALSRAGDVLIAIPAERMEALEASTPITTATIDIAGIRG